jgi:hypothetical protein
MHVRLELGKCLLVVKGTNLNAEKKERMDDSINPTIYGKTRSKEKKTL